jgi:hypothetical protein
MADKENVLFKDGVFYYKNGWKQTIGNMTKVYGKGTDYERGVQFGKLLAREIKVVIKSYFSFFILVKDNVPLVIKMVFKWMPLLLKPFLLLRFKKSLQRRLEKCPQWMVRELEGMAEGAKVDPFYLKFINAIGVDENALGDKDLDILYTKSCCSFAFTGRDGNIYHGKNLDWVAIEKFIDLTCFQQREDENGEWFAIIGVPGLLNNYEFGMNGHGISFGLTGRFYRGKRPSRVVLTIAVEHKILRYGKNLKQVQEIYNTRTGFTQSHALLVTSANDRDYKLFEIAPKGVAMTPGVDGKLFNTNTYVHPVLRRYNRHWGTIYDNRFRDPRHIRLQQLMDRGPETLDDAFAILADTVQPGFENESFLGQATVNRYITHVSALMVHGPSPGVWIARDHTYAAFSQYTFFDYSSKPQTKERIRPPNDIIFTDRFKNFKELMHLRESRYYASRWRIIKVGKELLERETVNPVFALFLAQNYLKWDKPNRAAEVLKTYPVQWTADYWYCLGQCRRKLKHDEDAENCFSRAMTLPSIEGFPELVKMVCLVQLVKLNIKMGLNQEVEPLKKEIEEIRSKFATPNIGMPDYPYINNIVEQMEETML